MSRMLPASMSLVVTSLSARLGSGLPDGWLWTTMMAFRSSQRKHSIFRTFFKCVRNSYISLMELVTPSRIATEDTMIMNFLNP